MSWGVAQAAGCDATAGRRRTSECEVELTGRRTQAGAGSAGWHRVTECRGCAHAGDGNSVAAEKGERDEVNERSAERGRSPVDLVSCANPRCARVEPVHHLDTTVHLASSLALKPPPCAPLGSSTPASSPLDHSTHSPTHHTLHVYTGNIQGCLLPGAHIHPSASSHAASLPPVTCTSDPRHNPSRRPMGVHRRALNVLPTSALDWPSLALPSRGQPRLAPSVARDRPARRPCRSSAHSHATE